MCFSDSISRVVTMSVRAVLLSGLLCTALAVDPKFPPNFMFGSATASYQVEGAWNASGKGENIWDRFVHTQIEAIADRTTGDVAADSYHKWEKDVAACAELGLHFYRFSLSWSRILPTGFTNKINEDGVRYYNNLIDGLLKHNIQPMVTLYHWDLPQKLQDLGGWNNPLIADWFAAYAKVAFTMFGDRVKYWNTINEPVVICELANSGILAPGIDERLMAPFICNKNILLAHAKAWRIYDEHFKPIYKGRVSIVNHVVWFEPGTEDTPQELVDLTQEFLTGRYSHPIYSKKGGWPPKVEKFMEEASRRQGFNVSKLPAFTEEERKLIRGTHDFYGLNQYTTRLVRKTRPGEEPGVWFTTGSPDLDIILEFDPEWETGASTLFASYPPGLRRQLAWLKETYGDLDYLITENGYSTFGSKLQDHRRVKFIHDYLEQILLSIKMDDVNVIGYTYWSLIDNYEWMDGYRTKFGLYEVDFNDPDRTRVPRESAEYYASIIKSNTLLEPSSYTTRVEGTGRIRRLRRQLAWLKETYGDLDYLITENGYSTFGSKLQDHRRVKFIHDYLEQILLSIKMDDVNVIGYTYWSLIDNYEWMDGYRTKFGLYEVDFNDPDRTRVPRESAEYYASIIKTNTLLEPSSFTTRMEGTGRIRRKEPVPQNGGWSVLQDGRQVFSVISLLLPAVVLSN